MPTNTRSKNFYLRGYELLLYIIPHKKILLKSSSSVDYQHTNYCRLPVISLTVKVEAKSFSETSVEICDSSLYRVQRAIILKFLFPIQRYSCQIMEWNPSRTFSFTFFVTGTKRQMLNTRITI